MSWKITIAIIAALIVVFLAAAIVTTRLYLKSKNSDKPMHPTKVALPWICTVVLLLCLAYTGINVAAAYDHGYYGQDASLAQLVNTTDRTPHDQSAELPDELTSCIVVLYKYGCPDCDAIYDDLAQSVKNANVKVYYVSSKSERGSGLCAAYDVNDVPTAIAYADDSSVLQKILYYTDDDKNSHFDADAFDRLIEWVNDTKIKPLNEEAAQNNA